MPVLFANPVIGEHAAIMHPEATQEKIIAGFHQDLCAFSYGVGVLKPLKIIAPSFQLGDINDPPSFMRFARHYVDGILAPIELPAILSASCNASQNELDKLLELDVQLSHEQAFKVFAKPSRILARSQLRQLRDLRGARILSRYHEAVMEGRAFAWHVLVYGLVLQTFSIPIRQGLVSYQWQVMQGFARAAANTFQWTQSEWQQVHSQIEQIPVPPLESLLRSSEVSISLQVLP
jgi:urease accessory protein UreF